ncbi:hypothetical protein KBD69_01675 [Candidatus Woesebacteria bacterium]|nr:hypothetical protein [Candidatus Woesebacteria bacterium]
MNKPLVATIVGLILAIITGFLVFNKKDKAPTEQVDEEELDLPINTIPQSERPFITLSPDESGRSLDLYVAGAPTEGELEYELVYQTVEVQEGVFGRLDLENEKQPVIKSLLLGSKSAGGKVTYHEGVSGGTVTVTYGTTRLKENFSYLKFDPADPTLLSTDGRFVVTLPKTALKADTRVLTMKTFGYPKAGLPAETAKLLAGPYSAAYSVEPKSVTSVEIKLPAGEHTNPAIYGWDGKTWTKLPTKLGKDSVLTTSALESYVVITD